MTTEKAAWQKSHILIPAGVIFCLAVVVYYFTIRPPQMGAAPEVFETVDALYTAVRNQDSKQVGLCEQRLHRYRDEGLLPGDATKALDGIITQARDQKWTSAAKNLYDFMIVQRREGGSQNRLRKG